MLGVRPAGRQPAAASRAVDSYLALQLVHRRTNQPGCANATHPRAVVAYSHLQTKLLHVPPAALKYANDGGTHTRFHHPTKSGRQPLSHPR
jgi:ribulose-5-phosphate 4-epimerase/fuculose-1-phosphate aldolase